MNQRILHQSFLPKTRDRVDAYVWKYSLEHGGRRPRHFHVEPELNLVTSGWAEFGVGETTLRVTKGELIGFPAGQDHVLLDTSPDVFLFAVGMAPMLASQVLNGQSGETAVPLHLRLDHHELRAITRRAELVVDRAGVEQPCAELWEQIHWLGRHRPVGRAGALHVLTKRALQVVSESPELGLEAVAHSAKSSPSEVSRYFHRDLGMTFVRYRTRLRLLRFMGLVEEGRGSWNAAATAAGFGSYSQCHRSFQSELGCSPRTYFNSGLRQEMQQVYEG
jgi:AraC-like DNA-binding protein